MHSELAADYRAEFEAPHRAAYDTLARDAVTSSLGPGSTVVDVGCGVGRWADWLVEAGRRVIGVEPSPAMARAARAHRHGPAFRIIEDDVDGADIEPRSADVVVAMGSIQYAPDPDASIARMAGWLRPGGHLWVLVDSLGGLVSELLRRGDSSQAVDRALTARARFERGDLSVEHHLFDATRLRQAFTAAGLDDVQVGGLLVAWNSQPRAEAQAALTRNREDSLAIERALAAVPALADLGKQLLAHGTAPAEGTTTDAERPRSTPS